MRRADIRSTIGLAFTAILVVGIFAFIGITFISSVDNARTFSARTDWKNEVVMTANKLISDPNCLGYLKTIVKYSNASGVDELFSTTVSVPLAIDRNKLFSKGVIDLTRILNCVKLDSNEYRMFIGVKLTEYVNEQSVVYGPIYNLDPNVYRNEFTTEVVDLPVKVISDNGFNYGLLSITMSVSSEYLKAKVL